MEDGKEFKLFKSLSFNSKFNLSKGIPKNETTKLHSQRHYYYYFKEMNKGSIKKADNKQLISIENILSSSSMIISNTKRFIFFIPDLAMSKMFDNNSSNNNNL